MNFNRQAYAIPTLYAKSLPKFESKQISTCLIILYPHDDFPEKPNIKGFADFYLYFNFDKYSVSSDAEKKMMQLEAVHQGMLGIAVEQGWNTELFDIFKHEIRKLILFCRITYCNSRKLIQNFNQEISVETQKRITSTIQLYL